MQDIATDYLTSPQGIFRALSDSTRREILIHLSKEDMTIGDVVDRFDVTRRAIKKHLIILEEGGLITVTPKGRERINRLEPMRLKEASDWFHQFNHFWDERLSSLKRVIDEDNTRK